MSFFSYCCTVTVVFFFFFFNDTATTEIYTLSLHDALPIFPEIIFKDDVVLDKGLSVLKLLDELKNNNQNNNVEDNNVKS